MRLVSFAVVAALALGAPSAAALVWPDVPDRVDRDLASPDPVVRLTATERLDALGPGRAEPRVLRSLADTDTAVRIAAAEVAVRSRTRGATALVLPWLGEHDARLRVEACAVARAVPDAAAVTPLARALSDADGGVRAAAAEALGVQGSREAVAPLLGKLDDPSVAVRVELARALARLGDPRAVVPLIGKVEDPALEVRQAVARALGDLGDARAAPALVLQLRDPSPDVRVGALTALGRLHAPDSVDAISPSATDRAPAVRQAALAALGSIAHAGGADALRVLVARLGEGDDATGGLESTALRDALVHAGAPAIPLLRGVLRSGAGAAAASSAAWVLGALSATAAAPDVVAALRRGTLPTVAALRALGAFGAAGDREVILEHIGDESPAVRGEARRALRRVVEASRPDGRAVEPLVAVAESARLGSAETVEVLELLGRTRAPRAAATLQGFLEAQDSPTRLAAIDALGALGPAGADAALVKLARDPLPEVRLHAAEALAASGGAVGRDALLDLLATGTELDRATALGALAGILSRAPSEQATAQLTARLEHAVGGERDAVLLALGRGAPVYPNLERLLRTVDADDRRTIVTACAGRLDAAPLLRARLMDADASVRAQAAWSLGSVGGADDADALGSIAAGGTDSTLDASVDATGALARVFARTRAPAVAGALCRLVQDHRPLVRTNALIGLSLGGLRCGDGQIERARLEDPVESVRVAAARAVLRTPRPGDDAALTACASTDASPDVADACSRLSPTPAGARATLAYVEPQTGTPPRALASYLVQMADGLVRAGTADRRGAFFDPVAPEGPLRLRRR